MADPSNTVHVADCICSSPFWCQHQLQRRAHRPSILSNVGICRYKHNDKLTLQPYTDTCTLCSRQTTTFRHVSMLTYCTFLQFLSTLHHPDWSILTGSTTLRMSRKFDEETWTALGQWNCHRHGDAKMWVHAVTQSPPATLCLSYSSNRIPSVPGVCNTSVTRQVRDLRMTA